MSGWKARQSRALTRWIVERSSPALTARRSAISALSSSGRKPSMRDQSARKGSLGSWACIPTSRSIISSAGVELRSRKPWRAISARLSAR